MDLYDEVLHLLEGEETHRETWHYADGPREITYKTFGHDRWIRRVVQRGVLTGLELLAVIQFVIEDFGDVSRDGTKIVNQWAEAIKEAAKNGNIVLRDHDSYLPLKHVPEGWEWVVFLDNADSFVASLGMKWTCTEIVEHLFNESFPQEPPGNAPEPQMSDPAGMVNNRKRWDDKLLKSLWEESLMPGVTQEALGKKYGVQRQRIGALLKMAGHRFGRLRNQSQFNLPSVVHRLK